MSEFTIRFAQESDCALILDFIRQLADYEQLAHQVVATEEGLRESLFARRQAEVVLAFEGGEAVGFALFFHNYSTFLGKAGLYLEDLFVKEAHRSKGYGRALFAHLAGLALERGCERLDWWCLDWNQSAIDFYTRLGAEPMSDWTVYRLGTEAMKKLVEKKEQSF